MLCVYTLVLGTSNVDRDREKIVFNFCVIAVLMKCDENLLLAKGFECVQSCHRDVPPYRALPLALMLEVLFFSEDGLESAFCLLLQ